MTITVLTSFLVVGAAAAAILGRDSVPQAGAAMPTAPATMERVVSNQAAKADRLMVASVAPVVAEPSPAAVIPSEPLRQAFAATPPAGIEGLKVADPAPPPAPPKPKLAAKPMQKSYTLLSDAQIAGIKERLKLSPSQESYWPAVETALRAVARRIHAARQSDPANSNLPIDPEAEEVQQLKSAAMPLLFQLREDQKREVRSLARLIGLEKVAAAI
jgi:hypothetical protein